MKIEADLNLGEYRIDAYAPDSISVASIAYTSSIIITPEAVIEDKLPARAQALAPAHVQYLLEHNPEVVLFGSGKTLTFPPDEACEVLYRHQIGFEIMDTGAACRAFNFLSGEGRKVAAALFLR
ncbi:MAG: MTH938/NDUFAF3 family protein [Gammaproteobacteria bacterium]|nr:MTH938/NDUFAF3 family protein [Gammaproteobacteria bacterium]